MLSSISRCLALCLFLVVCLSTAQKNPIKVKSAEWVGNVTSTNTVWNRDLGFQGKAGNCWINTFGDDFLCASQNPQEDCYFEFISSRDSAGFPTGPHHYKDVLVDQSNGEPEQFLPDVLFEPGTNPAGITNIVPYIDNTGIIYYLAGNATSLPTLETGSTEMIGAGFALVVVDSACTTARVVRVFRHSWYGNIGEAGTLVPYNETFYGDHGALLAEDGYIYAYGGIPGTGSVGLARVPQKLAIVLEEYEYWNGKAFQKERIYNPTEKVAVMDGLGQGTVFWNAYYKRYIYLSSFIGYIYARTAVNPWGPWSAGVNIWIVEQMPYRYIPTDGTIESFYTPAIQPKYSAANGKEILFWATYFVGKAANDDHGGHQVITAVRVTFD